MHGLHKYLWSFTLTTFFLILSVAADLQASEVELFKKPILALITSDDIKVRITGYGFVTELEENLFEDTLLAQYKKSTNLAEKFVIACSLYKLESRHLNLCLSSVPKSTSSLKKILEYDSPRGSYFKPVKLHFIDALLLAAKWDGGRKAINKLELIYKHTDGWQAETIKGFIVEAEETLAKKQTYKRLQ